jgi:hypothetical protein
MKSAMNFNIVMVCNFRLSGGIVSALVAEIRTFSDAGLKIGLLQVDPPYIDFNSPTNSHILHCVDSGLANWLDPTQRVDCDLLAIHEPSFLVQADLPRLNIVSRNRIMVAHRVPLGPTGKLIYDPWHINKIFEKNFGAGFIWAPVSPICRRQFHKIFYDLPLLADDWHNVIRVEDWGAPRASPKFRNCVIGRHSRPDNDKWPTSRRELLQCYPPDSDFEVRILGADSYLRKLVGCVPENWQLFAFNEIPPRDFLRTIDFFVYFHHPLTLETFGRAPAEAAAAGCVLVLPSYFQATFGNGAIYCQPQDVAATVRAYRSDPDAYGLQSQSGYETVRKHYSPESLLRLARVTMDTPRIVVSGRSSFYSHTKNIYMRLIFQTKLRVRKGVSNAVPDSERLVKGILRLAIRRLPGGMREWARQIVVDRQISRSPDRAILLQEVFPALGRTTALSANTKVLWIGCRRYTEKYYPLIERQGAECWSIDIEPDMQRWGRPGRHITGDMLELRRLFPTDFFDVVLCNGILGWGVDTPADQLKAFEAMATVMKPGGWLLVGWNTDRVSDPLKSGLADQWFEHVPLPRFKARYVVGGCTHVYDTYRRHAGD